MIVARSLINTLNSIQHQDKLPQPVQVAKILAAQELIVWPRCDLAKREQVISGAYGFSQEDHCRRVA